MWCLQAAGPSAALHSSRRPRPEDLAAGGLCALPHRPAAALCRPGPGSLLRSAAPPTPAPPTPCTTPASSTRGHPCITPAVSTLHHPPLHHPCTAPAPPLHYPWTTPASPLHYPWTTHHRCITLAPSTPGQPLHHPPLHHPCTTPGLPLDHPCTILALLLHHPPLHHPWTTPRLPLDHPCTTPGLTQPCITPDLPIISVSPLHSPCTPSALCTVSQHSSHILNACSAQLRLPLLFWQGLVRLAVHSWSALSCDLVIVPALWCTQRLVHICGGWQPKAPY